MDKPPMRTNGMGGLDPTANVLALSEASNRRQDDLREAYQERVEASIARMDAELRHLEATAVLRAEHAKEIGALESNRLNAIRQVDVLAVSTAADRAQAAIQTLAANTSSNAETLRNMVTNTAATMATQLSNTVTAITERIATLEKSSYEGKGKAALSDPMMVELIGEMKSLRKSYAEGVGKSAGISTAWGILLGVVALIATLCTIGSFVYIGTRATEPVVTAAPQVIYVPSYAPAVPAVPPK